MGSSASAPRVPIVESKHFASVVAGIPDSAFAGITIAITGSSSGIGKEVALVAAERGAARIFMLNRASTRASAAHEAVRAKAQPSTTVETIDCDLQSFASVRTAAANLVARAGPAGLHVLLLNAGVMACNEEATTDGYDVQMQTNHLAHFLLARECMPALEKAANGPRGEARVVSQSSGARFGSRLEKKYFGKLGAPGSLGGNGKSIITWGGNWERYHQTKLANVVFTLALHDRLQAAHSKVKAVVCEPGVAATNLQNTTLDKGGMNAWEARFLAPLYQSAEDGALPALVACFAPDVRSADFAVPKGGLRGPPVMAAKAGVFASPWMERACTHVPSRDLLWEASEAAVGAFRISK
ncbi:hypothetical protein KFE25_011918 [Diacronema lutheri]|uniref:Protochlorophyllide reductase n=1 Tax=Diacronema lutheri TaxID=2081491 RepID=A0A8J5XGE3_DIALT|nr:hypothetical protein KFE25_011918 [Diacronema lutheri]